MFEVRVIHAFENFAIWYKRQNVRIVRTMAGGNRVGSVDFNIEFQ
jgi:hypothetical protein